MAVCAGFVLVFHFGLGRFGFLIWGGGSVLIVCLVFCLQVLFLAPQEIDRFERQGEYLSEHEAFSQIEDAALTAKKVELNDWLFGAQSSAARFGNWSVYPDSVLNLEPIE